MSFSASWTAGMFDDPAYAENSELAHLGRRGLGQLSRPWLDVGIPQQGEPSMYSLPWMSVDHAPGP